MGVYKCRTHPTYVKPESNSGNKSMILTQIEIEPQTGGLAMPVINRVLVIMCLMQKLTMSSEPLILTGIYLERKSLTSCLTLRIRFDTRQSLTRELLTSYSQERLLPLAWGGAGASILESIRMTIIAISLSLQKAITTVRSFLISQ
jgi:hypothetical protein